jgi:hypothetical protein
MGVFLALSIFSNTVEGQILTIKGGDELCRKGDYYEVKWVDDSGPCDLKNAKWEQEDDQGNFFQLGGTGKTMFIWPDFFNYPQNKRQFNIRVSVTCTINGALGTIVQPLTIKIVDPNFFKLRVNGNPDCNSSTIQLELHDPGGFLDGSNLDDISWTLPSPWTLASGVAPDSRVITINTNGQAEGQRQVKVKYKAFSVKLDATNNPIKKKCGDEMERTAQLDISSCKNTITYSSTPTFPSSHSRQKTTFSGNSIGGAGSFNYVSGGHIDITSTFDFQPANLTSNLNLFIEDCSCNSLWHDPNNMGESSVSFPGQESGKRAMVLTGNNSVGQMDIKDISEITKLSVYPNPFTGHLTVNGLPANELVGVTVLGADEKVYWQNDLVTSESGDLGLIFEKLEIGFYILSLRYANKLEYIQIIKDR